MLKWLFILLIAVGAYMHYSTKTKSANTVQTTIDMPSQKTVIESSSSGISREQQIEEKCRNEGGRMISGMGCVIGAPENNNANPNFSASEVMDMCKQNGSRYEPAINACVSQ
jgi:hypothetical protein